MTSLLERAVAEAATLSDPAQDAIGSELLAHIEKLRDLRREIDAGLASLDAGEGRKLDAQTLIRRAREDGT